MPVIKSALKKLRQSRQHQTHNRAVKTKVKELIDAFKKSPSLKNYSQAVSALDKAAKTNIIHPNKAARLKSRLSKRLPKVEEKASKKPSKKK
ncbi:30S ribosomal protein S20 [Candidatus Gottesmanbacteria bacterium]|nr:30S ribosomal protein S20 [Candidatus Gottesmanbacteria bacterium]